MKFSENATVVYTTPEGQKIDTFVVFGTDEKTGLTHINHENLHVPADSLTLHPKTVGKYHMPLNDAFSFEMLNKLKAKYAEIDAQPKTVSLKNKQKTHTMPVLAKAS
ncbi:hypothetical protein EOD41_02800 [Mucilaginibacter limnophilus]|uniref:Uncharacterized protein n=1 Tax=Mucilaginibacter limnophilus TaxID=1932778 RepID=A0A437MZ03_9SPHI|nr:hypothetical protein [Mucilaginibacter limnophilus]RVU02883.1 hypothetical protein EOD41_02800 [Mucilaginibacter limnophilus]